MHKILPNKYIIIFIFTFLLFIVDAPYKKNKPPVIKDIQQIKKDGKLIAIIDNNSIDYFIYRGHPMGFQLELLQNFADYLNVTLDVQVIEDYNKALKNLINNKCDIIAMSVPENKLYSKYISRSEPFAYVQYLLVQSKPDNWHTISNDSLNKILIKNVNQLKGKTVFIPSQSSLYYKINNDYILIDGNSIFITRIPDIGYYELITLVNKGEINYAMSNAHIAILYKNLFSNLDFNTALPVYESLNWIVRHNSPELLDTLNLWIKDFIKTAKYKNLYIKYFKNPVYSGMLKDKYFSLNGNRISIYDEELKKLSNELGWDWRLLASLIFQESRFDTAITGAGGSMGMMQLMPETAANYGIDSLSEPYENLKAGVRYLKWLDKHYSNEIFDVNERSYFVLAAYNVGHGHVDDARALAKKYHYNPNLWHNNVDIFLKLKSEPEYYLDPVVKSGYCPCYAVNEYVEEIIQRYKHYANIIK